MLSGLLLILQIEILLLARADFNCHVGKFLNSFNNVHKIKILTHAMQKAFNFVDREAQQVKHK